MTGFAGAIALVALLAGAVSVIVGAGIGSLLIPLLALDATQEQVVSADAAVMMRYSPCPGAVV